MLKNIKGHCLSKLQSQKVQVETFPGITSLNILDQIEESLERKFESLIIHVETNDQTNDISLLSNSKICSKTKKVSPRTRIVFTSIVFDEKTMTGWKSWNRHVGVDIRISNDIGIVIRKERNSLMSFTQSKSPLELFFKVATFRWEA